MKLRIVFILIFLVVGTTAVLCSAGEICTCVNVKSGHARIVADTNECKKNEEPICRECILCEGTLSEGGRWCDQEDGTVKDMETGLVWLRDASWGGQKQWRINSSCPLGASCYDDAHTRAGLLCNGAAGANLSDGSVVGDWRLPTKNELFGIANGTEAVRSDSPRVFTGVQGSYYWSSNTLMPGSTPNYPSYGLAVTMETGNYGGYEKTVEYYVWPVRSDH